MASTSRQNLSEWLQFLLAAGIPPGQSANYAVSFVDNRIERDMLGELDKDYLKELGITVLGDIIAILKHAKKVAAQDSRVKPDGIKMVRTEQGLKKTTPASRLVDHFLKAAGSDSNQNSRQNSPRPVVKSDSEVSDDQVERYSDASEDEIPSPIIQRKQSKHKQVKQVKQITNKLRSSELPTSTTSSAPRRRVAAPVSTSSSSKLEVPVPKSRRVLPEHEGRYKIKMPSGTTAKTAKLLAEGKLSTKKAGSSSTISGVFSRLGDSQSPDEQPATPPTRISLSLKGPKSTPLGQPSKSAVIQAQKKADNTISFTVTGLGKVDPNNILSSMKEGKSEKAVFKRLGGTSTPTGASRRAAVKRAATSTQSEEPLALDAAPYIGVLKDGGRHSSSPKKLKLAAEAGSGFAVSRLTTENVKMRLGGGSSSSPVITRTLNTSTPLRVSSSVKNRLGGTSSSADSTAVTSSTDDMSQRIRRKISATSVKKSSTTAAGAGVFSRLGRR